MGGGGGGRRGRREKGGRGGRVDGGSGSEGRRVVDRSVQRIHKGGPTDDSGLVLAAPHPFPHVASQVVKAEGVGWIVFDGRRGSKAIEGIVFVGKASRAPKVGVFAGKFPIAVIVAPRVHGSIGWANVLGSNRCLVLPFTRKAFAGPLAVFGSVPVRKTFIQVTFLFFYFLAKPSACTKL